MNELRYIFYGVLLVFACIYVCYSFMRLFANAINIKEIAKTNYGYKKHEIDTWSTILFGLSLAYIIWFISINPLKSIQLW